MNLTDLHNLANLLASGVEINNANAQMKRILPALLKEISERDQMILDLLGAIEGSKPLTITTEKIKARYTEMIQCTK